jgi:hypothetical protein
LDECKPLHGTIDPVSPVTKRVFAKLLGFMRKAIGLQDALAGFIKKTA